MLTAVDGIIVLDGDVSVLGLVSSDVHIIPDEDDDISVVAISSVVTEMVVSASIVVGSSAIHVPYFLKNVRNNLYLLESNLLVGH